MDIIIVDELDTQIGTKAIDTVDWKNDIYRVSGVLISNAHGEILIAQRAFTKEHSPGAWGPSAAGIVEAHETYERNILKETTEELGITLDPHALTVGPKKLVARPNPDRRYFMQWHFVYSDIALHSFTLQKEEVADIKWISQGDLLEGLKTTPDIFADLYADVITLIPTI